jgi:TonB-dependent SusC/RagA subfamily outer membrane receptor
MKYLLIMGFVTLCAAAHAQEEKQYKLNPDSLANHSYTPNFKFNHPLYILDEKEITYEEVQRLDPNKLESITVLKDSASVATYGDKGKNGAILIALKPKRKE